MFNPSRFGKTALLILSLSAALSSACESLQNQDQIITGNPHPGYCLVMGDPLEMDKALSNPKLHSDYQGKRYYFCCTKCKVTFDKDPEKWIAHPVAPNQ
jgi:YHS domain-containing protein